MRRNQSGQKIGAQMTSATDGSDFTGAVTCYVTGDAGTQAIGSVASGACVHEGRGYQTYAPAQAETNYGLIAFTFKGTGAITVTVQVETSNNAIGTGADQVTLTFEIGGDPIADASVWVTSDAAGSLIVAGTLQTDSNGQAMFLLDDGLAYYVWLRKDGVNAILGEEFVAEAD